MPVDVYTARGPDRGIVCESVSAFEAEPPSLRPFPGVADFLNGLKPDRAWYR